MFTEIAKGVVGGFAELVGVKPEPESAREGAKQEAGERKTVPEAPPASVSGAVAAEVEVILETAQESAGRIVADAREEAARIVADARREAAVIADAAKQEAAAASAEAEEIETVVVPPSVATLPEQPAVVEADAPESPPATAAAADQAAGSPSAPEADAPEPPSAPEHDVPEPPAASPADVPDEAAVRLVAMNLAMGDASRAEIKAGVEAELGTVPGIEAILDDVLSRVR